MEASRKRKRDDGDRTEPVGTPRIIILPADCDPEAPSPPSSPSSSSSSSSDSTEVKLAKLSSLHPAVHQEALLDMLLDHDGSVTRADATLRATGSSRKAYPSGGANAARLGFQQSLKDFALPTRPPRPEPQAAGQSQSRGIGSSGSGTPAPPPPKKNRIGPRRGTTLHLYDPDDVAEHTPCTLVHNFLPAAEADELLRELLAESESFEQASFKLFEAVVTSPHTSGFYVESYDEMRAQQTDYLYNGTRLKDVRRITPQLAKVKARVQEAVNRQVQERIRTRYPGGRKLQHQSPYPWVPNSAFVNCYDGPQQSVGWHSDQLTYLGPRAVVGSVSLGVAREFRVRRILPGDADTDAAGQIAIHLPHNSLLVMHAEMQEEWKHCIVPAASVDVHPIAGAKRINITYRDYRANMHPRHTPRCPCDVPCVLRVVQRKRQNRGRYFWMCHAGFVPGREPCSFFRWATFDDDGNPPWAAEAEKR